MLRLRPFAVLAPTTVQEAVQALSAHGGAARFIAGGTDLVPNIKLAQNDPTALVSQHNIAGMRGVTQAENDGAEELVIGAGTRLFELAESPSLRAKVPAIAHAAGRIASPQIRNMATLGGNLCLDTRCRYINQSQLFREALGGCLKSHGSECHVVPGGQGCVAALSTDLAPILIAAGAVLEIVGPQGHRTSPLGSFYNTDGLRHINLASDELIVAVRVPVPGPRTWLRYRKWAVRNSIDFPLVSVALRLELESASDVLVDGLLVVGVLGPRPRQLPLGKLAGTSIDESLAQTLGEMAFKRCRPLPNVPYDAEYRRERLRVEVRRALRDMMPNGSERRQQ